jgi:hypothetical protein
MCARTKALRMVLSSPLLLARRRCFIWEKLVRRAGESTRDAGNWLFVVSVAAFTLGLILVMVGLVSPVDRQNVYHVRMLGPRRNDTTVMVRANDHAGSGSGQVELSMAMPPVPPDPARLSRPAASPPAHDTGHVGSSQHDGFSRRTYLLDSATVAHGYLVPRPDTNQVD